MHQTTQIIALAERVKLAAQASRQRRLLTLSGERSWCAHIADTYFRTGMDTASAQLLWVGENAPTSVASIKAAQARQWLGQELDLLVYDAWSGLDPDALAALIGCVRGGGIVILLTPPWQQWSNFADPDYQRLLVHPYQIADVAGRFIKQFQTQLVHDDCAVLVKQGEPLPAPPAMPVAGEVPFSLSSTSPSLSNHCLTDDQQQAVNAVIKVQTGHSRRPLVISSDRGRGKSSALGIAAAKLLQQGVGRIVVTGPNRNSVDAIFQRAAEVLADEQEDGNRQKSRAENRENREKSETQKVAQQLNSLHYQQSQLEFIAPDELLASKPLADLLLVDEAAAIPAPLLEQMLVAYNRVVFATTVHGYEGTGRGFDIRFKKTLSTIRPQWRALQLSEPIRWADNDPVEQFLFNALLLNAQPVNSELVADVLASHCVVEPVCRDELVKDQKSLSELFGLLVQAHYQTTPADLRNLLDGPNITVWLSRYQGHIVAAALLAKEGGFDDVLAQQVWQGERRPRGHLLAQSLSAHAGFKQAPVMTYQRVMRIAVHPAAQRQGLGRHLLAAITQHTREQGIDFLGSSFSATADVLAFWQQAGCVPVRLGLSRDKTSGCHSVIVLTSLAAGSQNLLRELRQRFEQQLPSLLMGQLQQLEPALVVQMLSQNGERSEHAPEFSFELEQQDCLDLEAFSQGYRPLDMCLPALAKVAWVFLATSPRPSPLSLKQQCLLVASCLQARPISATIKAYGLTGKKALETELRQAFQHVRLAIRGDATASAPGNKGNQQ